MYLQWLDPKEPVYIYINSTGTTRDYGETQPRVPSSGLMAASDVLIRAKELSKSVKSNEQPAAPVSSSSSTTATTTNYESSFSTPMISEKLKMYSHLKQFTFLDLKLVTRNFRPESLLGEGGFGCVFKGWVGENRTAPVKPSTGVTVAVKTLNLDGLQVIKSGLYDPL
ncbi:hypothetical protein IGI04_003052 [Brassica rapa subsp. trilocularis]|uniref:Protein kinase domain-containing protein n=1 Tax=Brassica rapa subsp. trilocularis TaxID=1813537 RepID=A0ABQ7NXB3_BRACM|nr:hypothetical protein IGI04_003052 [Brassica rapa subsp. trilocularis]